MYLTVHAPTSLIIGSQIQNPILAFVLAFIFHFILDIIPHDSIKTKNKKYTIKQFFLMGVADFCCILILFIILWNTNNLKLNYSIIFAFFGGILPDILWGLNLLFKRKIKILNYFHKLHSKNDKLIYSYLPTWVALVAQTLFFIIPLWIYLKIIH